MPGIGFRHRVHPGGGKLDPIVSLRPKAWFRADDWNGSGLTGRMGTEGFFDASDVDAPSPLALANNQMALAISGSGLMASSMPAAFWNFLASANMTAYVFGVPVAGASAFAVYGTLTLASTFYSGDVAGDIVSWRIGEPGEYVDLNSPFYGDFVDHVVLHRARTELGGTPEALLEAHDLTAGPSATNSGPFFATPPGTVDGTLVSYSTSGDLMYLLEWIFFDRSLSAAENVAVDTYGYRRYVGG